jgi:hypothetical protein
MGDHEGGDGCECDKLTVMKEQLGEAKARATAFFDEGIKRADKIRDLEARLAAAETSADRWAIDNGRIAAKADDLEARLAAVLDDLIEHKRELIRINLGYTTLPKNLDDRIIEVVNRGRS